MKRLISVVVIAAIFCIFAFTLAEAATERNSLTLINHSGDKALVKLVGPSRRIIEVPNGTSKMINIAGGNYKIYVRYGTPSGYRYTKGESFQIEETSFSYTAASLTLHGVVNGNYRTDASSENEFNRQ